MNQATSAMGDDASEILAGLPKRISDVLNQWAERSPERPALVEGGSTWTYGQLSAAIGEAETWLAERGVRPGDRVMIIGENCKAFVAILLALSKLDAWPVLVNARLSAREVDQILEHCRARLAVYTIHISPQAAEHAKRHEAAIQYVGALGLLGAGPLNEDAIPEAMEADAANNVAALIYTSGSTGTPKGVMLTHRNLLFVAGVSAKIRRLGPEDRVYGILPMSHAVGLSVVLLGALLSGATLYLSPRFDPAAASKTLENDRLTVMLGVPGMFALLAEYAKSKGVAARKFPALRIISSSGAPLEPALKAEVEEFFGLPLHNGYGVTECSPNIAQAIIEEPRKDTSVGRVFPGIEVKVVGNDGEAVAEGEVGELRVRGPNVMKGYYRAPEETAAAMDCEGWFNTRDLARLEGRNIFIVGRTRELIIRFGFNVYPAEIEAVLNSHSAVARSAVIGQATEGDRGGEEILVFVQLQKDAGLTANQLSVYAAEHLVPYKRPTQIFIIPELPMTPTGKIAKEKLGRMAASMATAR
jgi:long-chain acyl-CoA synthetase